ncbi:MAG TPA: hypothetical protein VM848_07070 [Acidimicrobiia bacterium]|nr:hypothetical protein [Acidimicrobiia bacterium]
METGKLATGKLATGKLATGKLASIAGALAAEDIGYLPAEELAAEVIELRRAVDLLKMAWTRRVALLGERGALNLEGQSVGYGVPEASLPLTSSTARETGSRHGGRR